MDRENAPDDLLLARILGRPSSTRRARARARDLLDRGSLATIVTCSGVGLTRSEEARVHDAVELGRRVLVSRSQRQKFATSQDVVRWAQPRLQGILHEELWHLSLDRGFGLLASRLLARGGPFALSVSPRDAIRQALLAGAATFVLVHNHPAGDPMPSAEDVTFTQAVLQTAHFMQIPLSDHVIVGHGRHYSFAERGALEAMLQPSLEER